MRLTEGNTLLPSVGQDGVVAVDSLDATDKPTIKHWQDIRVIHIVLAYHVQPDWIESAVN